MSQPSDLGEIWSLLRSSPKFEVGDMFYMAAFSPDGELDHALFEVVETKVVSIVARPIGDRIGLKPIDTPVVVTVPPWATLGKTRVQ